MAEYHSHPMNTSLVVFGRRLHAGEVFQADDVYDSTDGTWRIAPCPGLVLQEGCETYWVRPETNSPNQN